VEDAPTHVVHLDPSLLAAFVLKYGERGGLFTVDKYEVTLIPGDAQLRIYQDKDSYHVAVTFPEAEEPPKHAPVIHLPSRSKK
jgi:hypothetical protein